MEQAQSVSHSGQCDADVAALKPKLRAQLDKLSPEVVRAELREFGTWDEKELADHEANLDRLIWITGGDIAERQVA